MSDPSDTYIIGGAGLPVSPTDHPFDHPYEPRWFQSNALRWIYEDATRSPVAALAAPTGAGKTDVITALGTAADQLLCVYPTNALVNAQQNALEAAGLAVKIITGNTLSETGADRSLELLNTAQQGQHDVVITNPDVLQAAIQNQYFSPGSRILTIYTQFDAVVYDEFHYYDSLAASGLLTQIKLFSERGAVLTLDGEELPWFLLSSATPDTTFLEYIHNDLGLDLREIRSKLYPLDVADSPVAPPSDTDLIYQTSSEISETALSTTKQLRQTDTYRTAFETGIEETVQERDGLSRFRYPMFVRRHDEWIGEAFEAVADSLAEAIQNGYDGGDPVAAVIFNSAGRSNDFHQYLERHRPDIATDVTKDNGYDTNAGRAFPDETAALNTTSKGEVGLNFDIKRLIMAKPFAADQFVQRIGRAGRQSPAVVDLYGLDDPGWPAIQSYPQFLKRVIDTFNDSSLRRQRLRNLTGMRAAYALHDRMTDEIWHNESIFDDFNGFPTVSKWRTFFKDLDAANEILTDDSWTGPTLGRSTSEVIRGALAARDGLKSLRGRSLSHSVTYPRGDKSEDTEYDLCSALAHYSIEHKEADDLLHLTDELPPGRLQATYPGSPNGGDGIDLLHGRHSVISTLRDGYRAKISNANDLTDVPVDAELLDEFFTMMPVESVLVPNVLHAGAFEIKCDIERGEVNNIVHSR